MHKPIPTYLLTNLSKQESPETEVFFLNDKVENPKFAINVPFRTNYFGIGICVSGKAILKANLESYTIEPNYLVVLSPQIIRQFVYKSDDYKTISIFFTKNFIITKNLVNLDDFPFFERVATHAFPLQAEQLTVIWTCSL